MLHTSLGISSDLTIHLSFSLPLLFGSLHLVAVSLSPVCEVLLAFAIMCRVYLQCELRDCMYVCLPSLAVLLSSLSE